MKMQKVLIVLLASLIVMLLCSGVALAGPGNCCMPGVDGGDPCECKNLHGHNAEADCIAADGIWVGKGGCDSKEDKRLPTCTDLGYCTSGAACVPEMSTIALLATGLICMAGYLRLRRKEE